MTMAAATPLARLAARCRWIPAVLLTSLAACSTPPLAPPTALTSTAPSAGSAAADPQAPLAAATPPAAATPAAASAPLAAAAAAAAENEVVAAPTPVDPLRPEVRIELNDRSTRVDLWARVRSGFAMPDLDGDLVRDRERWYQTRPDYVARMTERGSRYLFHIVEELDKRKMPTELALLPFIESAFNPQAMSVASASGMWQFIPSTGRDFELKQNVFRDDRRDVLASTRAALDYLQKLHGMFNDWHLALAAYNWGEGSVSRAIARNRKAGLPTDYESLRMPNETRLYLPKLQAVKNIVLRPADYGLELPELFNHPYFLSVPIEHDIDVATAVRLSGLPLEEFKTLNPQMNRPVILAAGTPQVLLPYDNANRFVRELPRYRGPLATWTAWVAPKTLKVEDAARSVGMSEDELRSVNQIPARMLIKAGSTLLVPRAHGVGVNVPGHLADNGTISFAPDTPPLRKITLKAGKRDSVATIAKRYRVSPAQVADWNDVKADARFKRGEAVVVYVAPAPAKASRSASKRRDAAPKAATPRKSTAPRTTRSAVKAKPETTRRAVQNGGAGKRGRTSAD